MGFSRFLKENAGALSGLASKYGGGTPFGDFAANALGAYDSHQQEKNAARALADEQSRLAAFNSGNSGVPVFREEGSFLPKGISPAMAIGAGLVLVVLLRR